MDKFILAVCLFALVPLAILSRRLTAKYRNTKALLILQFCWFIIVATVFLFFLIPNYSRLQNIAMGAFLGGGLVIFFYKFKSVFRNNNLLCG